MSEALPLGLPTAPSLPTVDRSWLRSLAFASDSRSRRLVVINFLALILYALLVRFKSAVPFGEAFDTCLILISDACAALACYHASRVPGAAIYAKGWKWLAAANLAYVIGTLGWFFPKVAAEARAGLSLVDAPYFMFYPLVLLAAMSWPRRAEAKLKGLSLWLDAAVIPIDDAATAFGARPSAFAADLSPSGDKIVFLMGLGGAQTGVRIFDRKTKAVRNIIASTGKPAWWRKFRKASRKRP